MKDTTYRRGEVLLVRLDPVEGSEQGGTRPVLVVSNDALNDALPVLTVAAITSRKTDRVFPTEVALPAQEGGLSRPGKALLYQVRTVARQRVVKRVGAVGNATMAAVNEALRVALDLD